jgi:hypothetical protein
MRKIGCLKGQSDRVKPHRQGHFLLLFNREDFILITDPNKELSRLRPIRTNGTL